MREGTGLLLHIAHVGSYRMMLIVFYYDRIVYDYIDNLSLVLVYEACYILEYVVSMFRVG